MFVSVGAKAKLLGNKAKEQEEDIQHDAGKSR